MRNIKLLICLLFLSFPLVEILGDELDLIYAKEYFNKCQCDTASKEDCKTALKYCQEYLKTEKIDINKINEAKELEKK